VFEREPLPAESALRHLDTVVLSPHAASETPQSLERLLAALHDNLGRAVSGEPVHWVVNRPEPVIRRAGGASAATLG